MKRMAVVNCCQLASAPHHSHRYQRVVAPTSSVPPAGHVPTQILKLVHFKAQYPFPPNSQKARRQPSVPPANTLQLASKQLRPRNIQIYLELKMLQNATCHARRNGLAMPVGFTRLRLDIRSKPPGLSGWPESILRQFQGVKSFLKVCTISPSDSQSDSYHPGRDNLSHSCHINTDQCELLRISSQQSWQTGRGLRDNVMLSLDKSGRKK